MTTAAVELARSLVRLDTVDPPGDERAAAAVAGARLEAAGFEVAEQRLDGERANVVARLEGAGRRPALCLSGHLDVVPLGDAPWSRDPFGAEIDGDRLHGRGSSDMKGGVAAIVVAAERLAAAWRDADAGLELVLTCGEETGCKGARAAAAAGLLGDVGALLVAEPTANEPRVAHKGALWLRAQTHGRAAHGAAPAGGDNAIYPLARAIERLPRVSFDVEPHPLLGTPTIGVGSFHAGAAVNSVPDLATAEIDVRTIPALRHDRVVVDLGRRLGPAVELTPIADLPAIATDPRHPWVEDVVDALETVLGERPAPAGMAPFTDAAVLAPAYGHPPTAICGPGEPDQAHRTDEWCSISRIDAAVDVYVEIARRWCGL